MCNMCTRDISADVPQPTMEQPEPKYQLTPEKVQKINRSIERMKRKHNITTNPSDVRKQKEVEYQPDLLAVSTQLTKKSCILIKEGFEWFQGTKAYTVITRTTQPYQVAVALLVMLAWLCKSESAVSARAWKAVYVVAVATHLGTQIWMTLVSGLALYFTLPRHEFGRVQAVLFPTYYTFNSGLSLLALLAYFRSQYLTAFQRTSWIQMCLLAIVFGVEAFVRLRLVRKLLRAKHIKTQMEQSAGAGQEIGCMILGELAHCPRYLRVLKTFRSYHSIIAMGTIITLACSLYTTMIIVDSMC